MMGFEEKKSKKLFMIMKKKKKKERKEEGKLHACLVKCMSFGIYWVYEKQVRKLCTRFKMNLWYSSVLKPVYKNSKILQGR